MILDTLQSCSPYRELSPRIARGLDWLKHFSPDSPDGRVDLDGDELFALVQSYDSVPPADKQYESHRTYADIQYVVSGDEEIYYAPTAALRAVTIYDPQKDFILYADPVVSTPLHLGPGSFAIFFPPDGHKPGCISGATGRVKKVVLKVRV